MEMPGQPDGPPPTIETPIVDYVSTLYATIAAWRDVGSTGRRKQRGLKDRTLCGRDSAADAGQRVFQIVQRRIAMRPAGMDAPGSCQRSTSSPTSSPPQASRFFRPKIHGSFKGSRGLPIDGGNIAVFRF
jgi:hypothetical protein